ncbi:FO synthase [Cnuibacter physcomitrellae]|nr:7,8-didemethyl-8-hydroxy-5-deazariboflavin synthase CofG [Cnuibacter physcomitrellae]GGI37186.1 FO synthase [Cnuibacter physcomitrellae]
MAQSLPSPVTARIPPAIEHPAERMRAALDAARAGSPTQADAEVLFAARGADLDELLEVASRMRDEGLERRGTPGVITYSKKVFIPVTKLCRDRCHYCIFVETPGGLARNHEPTYLSREEILDIAREGAALGCKEALFTLGDRPEDRWKQARAWLDEHGYASTIDYLRDMAQAVLEETGLLPHMNPGVMSWAELQTLRPVAPSMGMMLETTATRLWSEKGGVHYGSPDKDPALRLRVIDDAGRSRVPFTTGVLLGIGETDAERAEALFEIRRSHETFGHVQETIVQNFRAKPRTAMQNEADLALQEYIAAVAVARVVMGPDATIQAPPNLTDQQELDLLVRAGIDDWGGVSPLTPDHVNPERPWPHLDDLATLTRSTGYELRERLTAHPQYLTERDEWIDPRVWEHVDALVDPETHLADESASVVGRPWSPSPAVAARTTPRSHAASTHVDPAVRDALDAVAQAGPELDDAGFVALLSARGEQLDELSALADARRRTAVGDAISVVVNRNLDTGAVIRDPRLLESLTAEAVELGASEVCLQGPVPADAPAESYLEIPRRIKAVAPDLHLHAFRPAEVLDASRRLGLSLDETVAALRDAGVDTMPGTGARILDDDVRSLLGGGAETTVEQWVASITAAHRAGVRTTSTMVFGHVETLAQRVAHLRMLASIQDRTGGFTEFIPMPYVPWEALPAVAARVPDGPSTDDERALHAVARLMLAGRIDHVQAAWTKLGTATAQRVLVGGADDLGGVLLDGDVDPLAGAEAHRQLTLEHVSRLAAELGRPVRLRRTDYSDALAPTGRAVGTEAA